MEISYVNQKGFTSYSRRRSMISVSLRADNLSREEREVARADSYSSYSLSRSVICCDRNFSLSSSISSSTTTLKFNFHIISNLLLVYICKLHWRTSYLVESHRRRVSMNFQIPAEFTHINQ